MSSSRIAKRYAKPLIELAIEKKKLEDVKSDMLTIQSVCKENKDFVLFLNSPIIPSLKKASILQSMFKNKMSELSVIIFDLMSKKNRESYIPNLAEEFIALYNEKMGLQPAMVTTSFKLDKKLTTSFEKLVTDVTGKKPILVQEVDESILGGYVLRLDDTQIDESVKTQLKELGYKFSKEKN